MVADKVRGYLVVTVCEATGKNKDDTVVWDPSFVEGFVKGKGATRGGEHGGNAKREREEGKDEKTQGPFRVLNVAQSIDKRNEEKPRRFPPPSSSLSPRADSHGPWDVDTEACAS
jgi:hypothetical protein